MGSVGKNNPKFSVYSSILIDNGVKKARDKKRYLVWYRLAYNTKRQRGKIIRSKYNPLKEKKMEAPIKIMAVKKKNRCLLKNFTFQSLSAHWFFFEWAQSILKTLMPP